MSLLSFFGSKKSYITSGLLDDMTDIHCHILPDVDDGVSEYEEAVDSLHWLKSKGVSRMYLTPHVMSDFSENTSGYLSEKFDFFVKRLENDGIGDIPDLRLGAEYMLEAAFEKQKAEGLLTYADHHVLIETSYIMPPVGFLSLLEELMESGYSPVLAHPERYTYMDMDDYKALKGQGIKFQLNFLSMTGAYGPFARKKAIQLLKEDFYDYTGSDFHYLARHKDAFSAEMLTPKQISRLQILFRNNRKLWETDE
ncbi:MAG: hypothetical protein LBV74_22105 [Tannerella sp.]|jgi:tyrosine-protein phosphatase YwqE|nr:hypothetical protein [Tannerella sp.]